MHNSAASVLNQSHELFIENAALKRLSNTDSGFGSLTSQRSSAISKRSSGSSHISTIHQYSKHATSTVTEIVKSESITQNLKSFAENQVVSNSIQSFRHQSSSSNVSTNMTMLIGSDEVDNVSFIDETVPPIPQKTKRKPERQPSPYDNVPDGTLGNIYSISLRLQQLF